MGSRALAVMLKAPVPGFVKTRLSPPLSLEEGAALYGCFIRDFFERIRGVEASLFGAFTPEEHRDKVSSLVPGGVCLMAQAGDSLGERIYNVFRRLFEEGYGSVVVTGSDSPDLPLALIRTAFEMLEDRKTSLVLGPALDGGYYLIGLNALTDAPFGEGIPWGTGEVLRKTIERAEAWGLKHELLPPWHDIDCFEDLDLLRDNREVPLTSLFIKALSPPAPPRNPL